MFDVKHEWQKTVMKLMQIILEKSCRKNLKIKISDERKERNAHVKKKKLDRKCGKETVGHAKCLEVVARQSQRDWPNSGFLVILLL